MGVVDKTPDQIQCLIELRRRIRSTSGDPHLSYPKKGVWMEAWYDSAGHHIATAHKIIVKWITPNKFQTRVVSLTLPGGTRII